MSVRTALGERVLLGAIAKGRLPVPRSPASGPLDVALGLLAARAAPFHRAAQSALYRRLGWPDGEMMTHVAAGRAVGISRELVAHYERRLRELLVTTGAPGALCHAVSVLVDAAPCPAADAALAVRSSGATRAAVHPAAVLRLARLAGLEPTVCLAALPDGTSAVLAVERAPFLLIAARHVDSVVRSRRIARVDAVLAGCDDELF